MEPSRGHFQFFPICSFHFLRLHKHFKHSCMAFWRDEIDDIIDRVEEKKLQNLRPCHTLPRGTAPGGASCPIHTNKQRQLVPRNGLPYFAACYCAAPYNPAFLLLDFALLKKRVLPV
uniref:Uncharacterized protein n=1 Tax=Romanomermis culicivorax TaxID=13658 RepID=A0A915L5E3_ROMCU